LAGKILEKFDTKAYRFAHLTCMRQPPYVGKSCAAKTVNIYTVLLFIARSPFVLCITPMPLQNKNART